MERITISGAITSAEAFLELSSAMLENDVLVDGRFGFGNASDIFDHLVELNEEGKPFVFELDAGRTDMLAVLAACEFAELDYVHVSSTIEPGVTTYTAANRRFRHLVGTGGENVGIPLNDLTSDQGGDRDLHAWIADLKQVGILESSLLQVTPELVESLKDDLASRPQRS